MLTVVLVGVLGTPAWPACPPGSNQANCQGSEPQHQPPAPPRPQPFEQQHQAPVQQQVQPQFQRPAPVQQQVQPQFQRPAPVQQQAQPQFQQQHPAPVQQLAQPQMQQQHPSQGTVGPALRAGAGVAGSSRAGGPPVRDSHAGAFSYHGQAYAPFRASRYRWPNGMGYRRYGVGGYLPLAFIVSAYVLADWMDYGLAPPPPGDEWVRYGPDVLLVDPATGQVVDGAYSAFAEGDEAPPPGYSQAAPPDSPLAGVAPSSPPVGYAPQLPPARGPQTLGNFGNWVAAAYQENGQPVCYASTQAVASTPPAPNRAPPVLTVTQRANGRDAVSIGGIVSGAGNAGIRLEVGRAGLDFYPAGATAFANNGAAAVVAFQAGSQAAVQTMSPNNVPISDTFSLIGFSAAYAAINAACPAQ